ncbi:hypothetical protein, partial [Segatella copri]|uniref:hypothetical protein n=1 Tax=Segatella copri TaxID=165179 RepID=UPI001EE443DA
QVVCPYVRATPSLQGTQLYLLAKVIIFHQFSTFLCLLFEGQQSVVIYVIKNLNFPVGKEKAARISCENILAALYGSLKKLYFLS